MRKPLRPALIALFLVLAIALRGAIPFPHESSDLKPDPQTRFGTLPNGLRYVIRPNREPKDRVSIRLLVLAGSMQETDDQRGLAHFLEHMAFNGSAHYKPGTLIEFFQRMGMNFGGDTNANTGFDRTLYLIELPKTDEATVAEGLRVLGDYAGSLLLLPEQINKERGIILSEKRDRDSVEYRTELAQYEFALGTTRLPSRMPIGQTEIIEQAQRDRFADFWNTWYRPEKMVVVAVGDIDPAAIEQQIVTTFSPITPRAPARSDPDLGAVASFEGVRAQFHAEPEAPATTIEISALTPYAYEPDTAALRLKRLPRELALAMLDRRFSVLAKKENAPFSGADASVGEVFDFFRESDIDLTCKPEQWQAALAVGEQELRRALEFGFQPTELKEAAANLLNALDQSAKTAATRRSEGLATQIAQSLVSRRVFTSPADDLALLKPAIEKITPADCVAALREAFAAKGRYVLVAGNAKIPGDTSAALVAAYTAAHSAAITAPTAEADTKWAYTDFGAPGKIQIREHIDDLDLTLVTFANGVRLNLKKTDFEANRIRINVRLGTGQLTEPMDQPGLALYAGQTFTAGGLGQHSVDDLRRILAGKTVGARFGVGGDAFTASGTTNRDDLLLEFQIIAAQITDPGYRPEAARQMLKGIEQIYLSFEHTPDGPMALEVERLLHNGDRRFGFPAKDAMLKRNLDEVKVWLAPQLAHGALEVALVGDLDVDAAIAAVAQTLGALPPRDPKPALDDLRKVAFPAEPFVKDYTIPTEIPKGTVSVYWPSTDGRDIHRARRLSVLAEVLSDRLRVKVREELGDAYSPGAGSNAGDLYPGYGFIMARVSVDPAKAKVVTDLAIALADDLAKNGVTPDELDRAKKPILTSLRDSARTNPYWLNNVLARAQEKPEVLDWCRSRYADIEAITKPELDALAKSYLGANRASHVTVLPAPAAPAPAPAAK